ncbi:MAG: NADH-quinone oxidoreductase subunit C [SAR324 cluster bacterium]|nr:NADH-quinone oxidoreductase subunit C [SAR324 cluster bacterium]
MEQHWLQTGNGKAVSCNQIPSLPYLAFNSALTEALENKKRVVSWFGMEYGSDIRVFAVCSDNSQSALWVTSTNFEAEQRSFPSLASRFPAVHLFECELYEQHGLLPENHPWLKPVRFEHGRKHSLGMHDYPFFHMDGAEVHEVGVGPVHAGVIEPGHFRFQCHGETVFHLEIQLGYQHRGLESLFLQKPLLRQAALAESITGDTSIGHVWAYAQAMEGLTGVTPPERAQWLRVIALELERLAMHIGDLGALSGDIAFLPGLSVYGRLRTEVINTSMALSGSRFGRGLIRPGGVVYDVDSQFLAEYLPRMLTHVEKDMDGINEMLIESPSVIPRLEHTGLLSTAVASEIGVVGFVARSSGIAMDSRHDHPYGGYVSLKSRMGAIPTFRWGDVEARTKLRIAEAKQSIQLIWLSLIHLNDQSSISTPCTTDQIQPDSLVVSMVEGWRGEVVHCVVTGPNRETLRYKIKDPSFHNWFGLAQALRNNGISDFPLCNKSFNLSYSGFDL